MKKIITLLTFLVLGSAHAQMPEIDPSKIEAYVTPFYNSEGPSISVGAYSSGLESSSEGQFLETIEKMKENWNALTVEELYVAAAQLYNHSYRNESVYWFYAAQLRSRAFMGTIDKSKMGSIGSKGFELYQAQNAFFQLFGPYINGYAFTDTENLKKTLRRVKSEGIPDITIIYPKVKFESAKKRESITNDVLSGIDKFISYLENDAASIQKQREEAGMTDKFDGLKNKELTIR